MKINTQSSSVPVDLNEDEGDIPVGVRIAGKMLKAIHAAMDTDAYKAITSVPVLDKVVGGAAFFAQTIAGSAGLVAMFASEEAAPSARAALVGATMGLNTTAMILARPFVPKETYEKLVQKDKALMTKGANLILGADWNKVQ